MKIACRLTCCTTMVARGVQTELIGFEVKFILPFILALLLVLLAAVKTDDDTKVALFLLANDDVCFWQSSNLLSFSVRCSPRDDDAISDGDSAKKSIFKSGMGEGRFELVVGCS